MRRFTSIPSGRSALAAIALAVLACAGNAQTTAATEIIDIYGAGTGEYLMRPQGIAVDAAGNVYVSGYGSNMVFQITPAGDVVPVLDSGGDKAGKVLTGPRDLAVDAAGNLFVTGYLSRNAFRVTDPGTPAQTVAEIIDIDGDDEGAFFVAGQAIAVDAAGNAYAASYNSSNVFKITNPGQAGQDIELILDDDGEPGPGDNLALPQDVAVDGSGNVYVTGGLSDNVYRVTPGGTIQEIMTKLGDGTNDLDRPYGVAADSAGNVYVVGAKSQNVFRITNPGQIDQAVAQIMDSSGDGLGNPLLDPRGIAVDAAGSVYVTGVLSDNAFRIDNPGQSGQKITQIIAPGGDVTDPFQPWAIAVDAAGVAYVAGEFSDDAFRVEQTIVETVDASAGGGGLVLDKPEGVAVDASGNVYVTGEVTDNVLKIAPDGTVTEIINQSGDGVNSLVRPGAIAVDGAQNVYVAGQWSDNAFKITPGGGITQIIDSSGDGTKPLMGADGIAVSDSGNVYVSGGIGPSSWAVFKITPSGVVTQIIADDWPGISLGSPSGIDVDGFENVYVTGYLSGTAYMIAPDGTITKIPGPGPALLSGPTDIAADGSGSVYVLDTAARKVFKTTDPGGAEVITTIIDEMGDGAGNGLSWPTGLAVGPSGNVYVSGHNTHNAFEITPDGVITEIVDANGAGQDGPLEFPQGVAVNGEKVYVVGEFSDNVLGIVREPGPDGDDDGLSDWLETALGGAGITITNPHTGDSATAAGSADSGYAIESGAVSVELPAGTTVAGGTGTLDIVYVPDVNEPKLLISGADLAGQTKSVEMPMGASAEVCIDDRPSASIAGLAAGTCPPPPPLPGCPPDKIGIAIPAAVGQSVTVDTKTPSPECEPVTYVVTRVSATSVRVEGLLHTALGGRLADGAPVCTFRNGSGVNLPGFSCLTPPAIGTIWQGAVDTTPTPGSTTTGTAVVFGIGGPTSGVFLLGGQELLISPPYLFDFGLGTHGFPVPSDPTVVGTPLFAQGIRLELDEFLAGAIVLQNARDLVLGF